MNIILHVLTDQFAKLKPIVSSFGPIWVRVWFEYGSDLVRKSLFLSRRNGCAWHYTDQALPKRFQMIITFPWACPSLTYLSAFEVSDNG